MTSNAFELVEAELLHTLGVLLVEAYESCVEMSKNARFLDQNEEEILTYNLSSDSMDVFMFLHLQFPPLNMSKNQIHIIPHMYTPLSLDRSVLQPS
jgi:hypothetical protein